MAKKNVIKFGDYFVADVALCASNPVHRVIAVCDGEANEHGGMPTFALYSKGYENVRRHVNPARDLYFFDLKEKLINMDVKKTGVVLAPKKTVNLEFE